MRKSAYGMFTIFNRGTAHAFNPTKKVIDQYTNKETTLLEIHTNKVKEENHKQVYIIDNNGDPVKL